MGFTSPQLAQASMTAQVGGGVMSAIGSMAATSSANTQRKFQADTGAMNAKSTKQTLPYQADVADLNASHALFVGDTNARIAELGAQSALEQGDKQVGALTLKAGQMKSSQRAAMAANGVDLGEGNAAEVAASTEIMKQVDVNTITANAVRSAMGYRTQAVEDKNNAKQSALNYKTQADFSRVIARNSTASPQAVDSSVIGAGATSLMGGAASVANSWYQMDKASKNSAPTTLTESAPLYTPWS